MIDRLRWAAATIVSIARYPAELRPWLSTRRERRRFVVVTIGAMLRVARIPVPIPPFWLTVAGRRHPVRVANHYELAGAIEVLATGDYDVPLDAQGVRRVLDLGANVGFASILFASRFPLAEIVAVEPAPDTASRLEANLRGLDRTQIRQVAVGAPGQIMVDLTKPSTERRGGPGVGGVLVPRIRLAELLDELGWSSLDLLKVDIEGDEFDLLNEDAVTRARYVVGELHPHAAPNGFPGLAAALPRFQVEVGEHRNGCAMFRAVRSDGIEG